MANVNINRNLSDQFYRYKMPKLVAKVEGKGNGIKTVIVNMPEIAKSLNRPPMYPTKYFGCLLGAQVNFDNKSERYIVNGSHDPNKLQDLLDGFIQKYVLCQSCENPETALTVDKNKSIIKTKCQSCGYLGTIQTENDRFATYVLQNPPTTSSVSVASTPASASAARTSSTLDDEDNSRNRKRGRFEADPPASTNKTNQISLKSEEDDWYKSCQLEESDDSVNLEEIDYGDDDDDFNEDSQDKNSNDHQTSRQHQGDEFVDSADVVDDDDGSGDVSEGQANEEEEDEEQREKEVTEKCKYWPACNAGEDCPYYHPTKPCRAFPNCRFGRKCLYIHPTCKYAPNCTKPHCPFAHPAAQAAKPAAARRPGPGFFKPLQQPLAPKCKFGAHCLNRMCQFTHTRSEPCRFGANCLLESCPFTHPSNVEQKKPNTSVFKWSAQS